jgi:hypothetical protein
VGEVKGRGRDDGRPNEDVEGVKRREQRRRRDKATASSPYRHPPLRP